MRKLVIIPAFNEEKNLLAVVNKIKNQLSDFDYIVINDGSSDNTMELCKRNNINVINLPVNLGIGGAVQTGYKYAKNNDYDVCIQIDGDGQHNSDEVRKLLDVLTSTNAHMVIGSRFIKKVGFQSTFLRRLGILYFSKLIKLTTHKTVTDPTSGFRICNKEVIDLFSKTYPSDYPEPETCVMLFKKGFKVVETDTLMNERMGGVSSINSLKSIYYMIKVSLAILFCKA
jgi:glycosyltransferase involved in cell wall biosynthesis